MKKITLVCITFILIFSVHCKAFNTNIKTTNNNQASLSNSIQRVRLDVITPMGYTRHLLLGFIENIATDGFDYGYDALNPDNFPDDCNWLVDNRRCVIQGVGVFNKTKKYPLGLFLENSGTIEMSLNSLENFDSPVDVYIYDAVLDSYFKINETTFSQNISSGEYLDRFFIAFQDENELQKGASLSIEQNNIKNTVVRYLKNNKELYLKANSTANIKQVQVYNILGKELFSIKNINESEIRIPFENIGVNLGIVSVTTEQGIISKKIVLR